MPKRAAHWQADSAVCATELVPTRVVNRDRGTASVNGAVFLSPAQRAGIKPPPQWPALKGRDSVPLQGTEVGGPYSQGVALG